MDQKKQRMTASQALAMLQDIIDGESDGEEISGLSDVSWSGESDSDSDPGSDHEPRRKRISLAVKTICVPNASSAMPPVAEHAASAQPGPTSALQPLGAGSADLPVLTQPLQVDARQETGKDGTVWRAIQPSGGAGGMRSQNVLTESAGPTAHARRSIEDPLSAFMCLFDRVMLQNICDCTVKEARSERGDNWDLSVSELKAFLALIICRGVHNGRHTDIEQFWSKEWGMAFFIETMSRNRFREIMHYLRFDRKETRHVRLSSDKFALMSEVWDRLVQNSINCYKPGADITVDDQLFPTKACCRFIQYVPGKPDKFGIKFWLAADVETKYMVNGYPYLGKDEHHARPATQSVGESVVMNLMQPYLGKGRNVTTGPLFTSLPLARKLLASNTSLVGTVEKNERSLPPSVSQKAQLHTVKVMKSDKATITIYQGKVNKNVCVLSTMHQTVNVARDSPKKTPDTVRYYNKSKVGVGVLDRMARRYSARAATRRWPVAVFYNMLDLAGINACVLYRSCAKREMARRDFLLQLCKGLRGDHMQMKGAAGTVPLPLPSEAEQPQEKRRQCAVKMLCNKNKTVKSCVKCRRPVCGPCTVKVFSVCALCE